MSASESHKLISTQADIKIAECINNRRSFAVIAGAGSGKTTSLITALKYLRDHQGKLLRRDDKQIACVTYTKRAVQVIFDRLDHDELFSVSTIHKFLWEQIGRFPNDIRKALKNHVIPQHIARYKEQDNGGKSKKAIRAREKLESLEGDLNSLDNVNRFEYDDVVYSDYISGKIGHDDVVETAAYLIQDNDVLRKIMGQRYPYIFVDEAQDTFDNVVAAFNKLCAGMGLPVVGYFGDPMQQIYDKRAGDFVGPENGAIITKEENFRCSKKVIALLNAFRKDVQQIPAGENKEIDGSVFLTLVNTETPAKARKQYTEDQLVSASQRYEKALAEWGWHTKEGVKSLFLVRQMIARRLGFPQLHKHFTGRFASQKAQEDYEAGEHYLLKPFVNSIYPLITAHHNNELRNTIDTLRKVSPTFDPHGRNSEKTLREMKELAAQIVSTLDEKWKNENLGDVLRYCRTSGICRFSERLVSHLDRKPRDEEYDDAIHSEDKGDWLADLFLKMDTSEIGQYVDFVLENTPYSTQHGVKGEEYKDVIVVFDDNEAAWHNYSFTKMLTPETSGSPTEGQDKRSKKLAYVCFSRAVENLRILLFTPNAENARNELVANGLFKNEQIDILS